MAGRKSIATDNPIARDILSELQIYAQDEQFYLVQNSLFTYMTKPHRDRKTGLIIQPRYPELGIGKFNYQFGRLVEDGFIQIDPMSRALRCTDLTIVKVDKAVEEF